MSFRGWYTVLSLWCLAAVTFAVPQFVWAESSAGEMASPVAPEPASPVPLEAYTAADALWEKRSDLPSLDQAIEAYKSAVTSAPDKRYGYTMLARAHAWKADAFAQDLKEKKSLFHAGYDWGMKALSENVGFRKTLSRRSSALAKALAHVSTPEADALLWTTYNLTQLTRVELGDFRYQPHHGGCACTKDGGKCECKSGCVCGAELGAKPTGPLTLIYAERTRLFLDRLLELAPEHAAGAPLALAGSYAAVLPHWAGGDLDASLQHFEAAFKVSSDLFMTHTLFARDYLTAKRDRFLFRRHLEYVITHSPEVLSGWQSEQLLEQGRARMMLEAADGFLPVLGPGIQAAAEAANR